MAEGQTSHKNIGGEVLPSEWLAKSGLRISAGVDPVTMGGVLWGHNGKPAGFIKPPYYRHDPSRLATSDVVTIPKATTRGSEPTKVGMEVEVIYIDENGNLIDASDIRRRNNLSLELANSMAEANLNPHSDAAERAKSLTHTLKALARAGILHPFSNLERPLQFHEVTPHEYVHKIVAQIGFDRLQDFTATGIHVHKEWLDPEIALDTINRAELVFAPLLLAMGADAPIARMTTTPNIGEIFLQEDPGRVERHISEALRHRKRWHTTRYPMRVLGSTNAGTLPEPLPTTLTEYYEEADRVLQAGDAVSVARIKQNHGNFRYRPEYGTIEVCLPDKAGLHAGRIMLMQEFVRHALIRIETVLANNQLSEYAREYPRLFSRGSVIKAQLQKAQLSNIEVAKHGTQATIYAADGKTYQVADIMDDMLRFMKEPVMLETQEGNIYVEPFPEQLVKAVERIFRPVPDYVFRQYETIPVCKAGKVIGKAVSPAGYYSSFDALGTASDWMHATIESLQRLGLSEKEVIAQTRQIYSTAIDKHIRDLDENILIAFVLGENRSRRTIQA